MMAVPQYPYPVTGGLERQAHELAKALSELRVAVQALSGAFQSGQPPNEYVEGVLVHRIPWPERKATRFLRTPFEIFKILSSRRATYDVIHLHQYSWFGLYVILCARLLGKPVLTKLPNVGPHGIPGLLGQWLGRLRLAILLKSDALVTLSAESLRELESVGFPSTRTLAAPNGIRLGRRPRTVSAEFCSGVCKVVFAGRLNEQKMLDILLKAWRKITHVEGTQAVLEIWGTGLLEGELKRLASSLNISGTVSFRGHVDSVHQKLPAMDIFVLPSFNEGNSNAVLEAMAAGLPIVSTRVGGTHMQVGPEGAHFLSTPGDIEGLAINISTLVRDPVLRATLGQAMRARAERHFDIRMIACTYAKAYKYLKEGRRNQIFDVSDPIISDLDRVGSIQATAHASLQAV